MAVKTLLAATLTLLSFAVVIAAAQAMPFHSAQAGLTIPIASGCGIGVHRGPYAGCDAIYGGHYRRHYRAYNHGYYNGYYNGYQDGYYDGSSGTLIVDQGACSGFRMYRACNIIGRCWMACRR
jgi:hypothetical protein